MKGLYFESSAGNRYFYHNGNGFIFPADHIQEDIPEPVHNLPRADAMTVKEQLEERGFRELILEMSMACNFRCRYCCYGEHYQNTRNHGKELMCYETAKEAVDFYMSHFETFGRGNIWRNPIVAFYGGEPLLNYEVIRQVVEYIEVSYADHDVEYTITTNGYLLTEDKMNFFVKHNFSLIVSFDGNQENHDRNRVDLSGRGTYEQVYRAVRTFKDRYPDYLKFGISLCFDYRTDLAALEAFVEQEKLFIVSMSMISNTDTDYYEQFTEEEKEHFMEQYMMFKKRYLEKAFSGDSALFTKGILPALFAFEYLEFGTHSVYKEGRAQGFPYTGSCIPGEKLYVTVDRKIHICEKMAPEFSIGDLKNGLDYEYMAKLERIMNKNYAKCSQCDYSRFCNICYARSTNGDKLKIPENYCNERKEAVLELLKCYTDIMERKPELFESFAADYFERLHEATGNIVD